MAFQQITPFGDPEGSRANFDEIIRGFVDFGGNPAWGGLATRDDDLRARVIVGRKGSGKTVCLRRLQAHAADDNSLCTTPVQQDLPTTTTIIRFCQWFPADLVTEMWIQLWRVAILRSLASLILTNSQLSSRSSTRLGDTFREVLKEFRVPMTVYSQVSEVIHSHHTRNEMTQYLHHPRWAELESLLNGLLNELPPICLYIDGMDEV